jgi:hypothetical protein
MSPPSVLFSDVGYAAAGQDHEGICSAERHWGRCCLGAGRDRHKKAEGCN